MHAKIKTVTWAKDISEPPQPRIIRKNPKRRLDRFAQFKAYADLSFPPMVRSGLWPSILAMLKLINHRRVLGSFIRYDHYRTFRSAIEQVSRGRGSDDVVRFVLNNLPDNEYRLLLSHENYLFLDKLFSLSKVECHKLLGQDPMLLDRLRDFFSKYKHDISEILGKKDGKSIELLFLKLQETSDEDEVDEGTSPALAKSF